MTKATQNSEPPNKDDTPRLPPTLEARSRGTRNKREVLGHWFLEAVGSGSIPSPALTTHSTRTTGLFAMGPPPATCTDARGCNGAGVCVLGG